MRSKWIIALGVMVFDAILLYISSFFLYWGAWNYRYGTRPAGLEYFMLAFGLFMLIVIIIAILKTIAFLRRSTQTTSLTTKNRKLTVIAFCAARGVTIELFYTFP